MNVTATPAPKSAIKLEIELPPERLNRAVDDAVRRLSRRTRVPGFRPEIETIDDARVDKVVEELRDQNGTLAPVEDRGARNGDYAVISFEGTRDGQPFEGGSSERMPLILGEERLIPGFETHLEGLRVGESTEFDITFPDDYAEESLRGVLPDEGVAP